VVTNVHADHLGHWGVETVEEMAEVKSLLPQRTAPNGVAVLNADQRLTREMAHRSPARPLFFSVVDPPDTDGDCVFVRDGMVVHRRGSDLEPIVAAERIYITHGGAVTFQLANAVAALAVIEALQPWLPVSKASLERSVASFGRDPAELPRRLQLFRYQGADVLVSSSKNPETYAQEIPLLQRLARAHGYSRVICVLSEAGNRQETHYRSISRAIGAFADVVVCMPPKERYLRGRTAEEIMDLLWSEVPPEKVARLDDFSLAGLVAHFAANPSEPTLFISFSTTTHDGLSVEEVLANGELLPMRFDPPAGEAGSPPGAGAGFRPARQ
jgi:cyanophycin synthetase